MILFMLADPLLLLIPLILRETRHSGRIIRSWATRTIKSVDCVCVENRVSRPAGGGKRMGNRANSEFQQQPQTTAKNAGNTPSCESCEHIIHQIEEQTFNGWNTSTVVSDSTLTWRCQENTKRASATFDYIVDIYLSI
jgi:hypothetical protein